MLQQPGLLNPHGQEKKKKDFTKALSIQININIQREIKEMSSFWKKPTRPQKIHEKC